jgi:RNA recognition motif-containing protein
VSASSTTNAAAVSTSANATNSFEDDEKRFGRYPDSQQVFVGNLSQDLSEAELRYFFGTFGKVVEVRINTNTKQQSGRRLPNYGFVVFDDKQTVDTLLGTSKSNNLTYKNDKGVEFRLNVEEKRARQGREGGGGGRDGGRDSGFRGGKSNRATRSSSNGSRGGGGGNGPINGNGGGGMNKKNFNTHANDSNYFGENNNKRKDGIMGGGGGNGGYDNSMVDGSNGSNRGGGGGGGGDGYRKNTNTYRRS